MPTLSVNRDELFIALGQEYTEEEFGELCFEFGIELDEITTKAEEEGSEERSTNQESSAAKEDAVIYKIDIPANRTDLLCLEGLALSLNVFNRNIKSVPEYKRIDLFDNCRQRVVVKPSTLEIRPYLVCAVLRGVSFTEQRYQSFIELQDKLHHNICRRRRLVAIGTHDLSTLSGPFTYEARAPEEIDFVPLTPNDRGSLTAQELVKFYDSGPAGKHLRPYTEIVSHAPRWPVITDSDGIVLSLPPIINGHHSRIKLSTRDVLIECTATDLTKANIVLDTLVCMFSQYCEHPFTVEPVDVYYEADDTTSLTPLLFSRTLDVSVNEICSMLGIEISAADIIHLCNRMQLTAELKGGNGNKEEEGWLQVTVPPTRSDVLHACDVIEDIGIAFGYNNIPLRQPLAHTEGKPLRINHFSDLLREEVARAGYTELLTHGLCSWGDNFDHLRRKRVPAVSLSNPANIEYEIVRTSLLPGVLKTLQHNRFIPLKDGIRLFEVSDVVLRDEFTDTGARNERHIVAAYAGLTAGFEIIHGLVDRIMGVLQIVPCKNYTSDSIKASLVDSILGGPYREGLKYHIQASEDPAFLPGRCAEVILTQSSPYILKKTTSDDDAITAITLKLGTFGILHPEVLNNFDLATFPCSALELNLEHLQ